MGIRELLPYLPHEGPPVPRFLIEKEEEPEEAGRPSVDGGVDKPGCTIADEALTVFGHLYGLSEGWGGFGVLRTSAERLKRAASISESIGKGEIADQLREFSERLPEIHTEEDAARAAEEFEPIVREAWELGKHCGLSNSKAQRALALIKSGQIRL